MVVDVDEYWVANPFHTKIERFLAAHTETEADVISSNWLHCHRANLFDAFLGPLYPPPRRL